MAESSGGGAAPLMLSQKKRKLEREPWEGEDPLKGLVKPLTSADPDLDISTSGSKFTQASNPDLFSSIDFEEGDRKDDHDDDYGGRATRAKSSHPQTKPKLREPEGDDLQRGTYPSIIPNMHLEGSKSSFKAKLQELGLSSFFVPNEVSNPAPHPDNEGLKSVPKLGEPEREDLQGSVKTRALPRIKTRALPRPQKKLRLGEQRRIKTSALPCPQKMVRIGELLQKKLRLGDPEGEDLPGKKDPSLWAPIKVQVPDQDMEDSNSGSSVVTTQPSSSIYGGELLPLNDPEEGEGEGDEDDDSPMTQEELKEWWEMWWKGEVGDHDLPKSPGWGYSDVDEDEDDPHWPDKFREKYCRQTPPKYKALLDSDYCPPGVAKKDDALWERYLKQIEDSDGYDITDFPGLTMLTPITPVVNFKRCPSYFEAICACADAAIKKFNEGKDDQYEVHDILTVNVSGGSCRNSLYYITFEAKQKKSVVPASADDVEDDHGGASLLTTFQAKVLEDFAAREMKVQECRIKQLKPSTV